ncbi:MAG TPA: arylsulfatase [Verrucomicrobiae bacterium]|nr:arylsulfatase [Verrucomicrobiae bacterium]
MFTLARWSAVSAMLSVALLCLSVRAASSRPPNIILILTDDQGYGELSCHGNPILKTPNLGHLHAQSARFIDFQVSPTCSPTRSALLTGRHEFKNGVTHTIYERERLSLKSTTLAQTLKSTGYTTGIFGKWHLGDEDAYQPQRRGFDEAFIHGGGGIGQTYPGSCGDAPGNLYHNPAILHNGRFEKTKGFCTDVFFGQALRWIDAQRRADKPFFSCITPNAPHDPFVSPGPEYDRLFEGSGLNTNQMAYYGMIRNIDDNVGRLLAKLAEWGLEQNTLVIFMTDNGHSVAALYNAGMRAAKGTVYQGGVRVPSFWRWPERFPPGDRGQLAAHIDVFPTLAEIAGAKVPREVRDQWDGRSLLPVLKNPKARWSDRLLFSHVGRWETGQAAESKFRNCAVRNSRFKLVNNTDLYDLQNDPAEARNVIEEHPRVVAGLRRAYEDWWKKALPAALESEHVTGPKVNPFKERYWAQFGGGPDDAWLQRMDPVLKFEPRRTRK